MRQTAESRHTQGGRQQQPPQPQPWPVMPYYEPPGQRVIKHEDQKSEVETPWQQTQKAIHCRMVRYGVLSLVVLILSLALYIVLGKYAVFPIGAGAVIVAAIVVNRWFDQEDIDVWRLIAPAIGAGLVGVVALGVYVVHNSIVIPWQVWVMMAACWLAGFFVYVYLVPVDMAEYRYLAEVADPNGPTSPRLPIQRMGPVWPGTPEGTVAPDDIEQIREQLEQVLRHVKAQPPREVIRLINSNVGGNGGNGRPRDGEPVAQTIPAQTMVRALTSGRRVPMDALVTFLRKWEQRGTGAREWKAVDGWDEARWADVVEIWSALGVFEQGRPGRSGRFTVGQDDALHALLTAIEGDRPTPAEPVPVGQATPGQTGQTDETGTEEGGEWLP